MELGRRRRGYDSGATSRACHCSRSAMTAPATPRPPAQLPAGTVTFLFTDIEGSTRLWERDPEAMRATAARHDALMRSAVTARRGVLYKHVGDAVQAAFADPVEAVAAVVDAQRALSGELWEETGPIRAR